MGGGHSFDRTMCRSPNIILKNAVLTLKKTNSLKWLDKYIMYLTGCENSGQYSNAYCEGWKYLCTDFVDQNRQFMIDHCSKTCGFCDPGKLISILRNSSMLLR